MNDVHADVAAVLAALNGLGIECPDLASEPDNAEYGAAISDAAGLRFRVGKLTPRKVGHFVTVWRRASGGSTEPLPAEDGFGGVGVGVGVGKTLIVATRETDRFGAFVFTQGTLRAQGITSVGGAGGKRGFRVYPPWSATSNAQAQRSQRWQCEHFLALDSPSSVDAYRARQLLAGL